MKIVLMVVANDSCSNICDTAMMIDHRHIQAAAED